MQKLSKLIGLTTAIYILISVFIWNTDGHEVAITVHSNIQARLCYSFFHVSCFHALLNAWCLLSIIFIHNISPSRLCLAYAIAVCAPDIVLSETPTIGLSALCFALLGIISLQVRDRLYFNICIALYIGVALLSPGVNAWLHLYAYLTGVSLALMIYPIPRHIPHMPSCKK